ncbi:methyltransferase domain-containing protein [Actinoplanes sp. Pm04-4]|uniref:Methyltransferase domain-containing protein n=1 Tax=Paractinoplanes pyxinae TaxID=2997416 RepID=A0ABT4BA58_9ACTN|nr:class I SAM-dependent methyltransferase [Actinoplanes pyxinae]MCY1143406.1 methyltransferase domain-containing protein [Actinoplanes pyxinae]
MDLDIFYRHYPSVESEVQEALDESLSPRGPELLYDLVAELGLPPGARMLDVGCGEGRHTARLAARFGFDVLGLDPVDAPGVHVAARATELPIATGSVDLIWCRDVLVHVTPLPRAYAEFRRVLRPGGRAVVYQMFGAPPDPDWLFATMGVVPANADPALTEESIAAAGLRVDQRIDLGSEWGEHAEERAPSRHLLHAARLLREPERYVERFGRATYEIALGDSLWHVYRMLGWLKPRAYVLSAA